MSQVELFPDRTESDRRLSARFLNFHRANPIVYDTLRGLALRAKNRGHRKMGIGMLFEVARWTRMFETVGDEFKLNNSYRSRYARLLMREPELENFFELRELKTN